MADMTCTWTGASGQPYQYWIYPIGAGWKNAPGNYIFAKETSPGKWTPVYIGETEDLSQRLPNHDKLPLVARYGGTHIHAHTSAPSAVVRRAEEEDLIKNYSPPCNLE